MLSAKNIVFFFYSSQLPKEVRLPNPHQIEAELQKNSPFLINPGQGQPGSLLNLLNHYLLEKVGGINLFLRKVIISPKEN